MSPLAQVRHVFVKDVKEHRWFALLYLVTVAVATAHALDWRGFRTPALGVAMVLVGFVGVLLVASAMHGDSPTRSDAFWVSHPFDPYSVLSAKVVFALLVLATAVIGQLIVVASYDAIGVATRSAVVDPGLTFAWIIVTALALAALTRDLRSFALAAIGIPVLLLLTAGFIAAYLTRLTHIPAMVFTVVKWVSRAVELVLLVWLYRTRDARWRTRILGFVVAGLAFVTIANPSPEDDRDRNATNLPRVPVSIELPAANAVHDPGTLSLTAVVPRAPEGLIYGLTASAAELRAADGTTSMVPLGWGFFAPGRDMLAPTARIAGVRWLDSTPGSPVRVSLNGPLTVEQRRMLEARGTTITVKGFINVDTLLVGEPMPLAAGNVVTRAGRRTTIEQWTRDAAAPRVSVRLAALVSRPPATTAISGSFNITDYALINRRRGEALALTGTESGATVDGLVLPGSTITTETARYDVPAWNRQSGSLPDDAWLRDAELLPITRAPLGSYPVTLPVPSP